jgi:predicted PurR-regulated permease PerM
MMWLERIAHTVKMYNVEQLKEAVTQFGQTLSILMSGGESNRGRVSSVYSPLAQAALQDLSILFNQHFQKMRFFSYSYHSEKLSKAQNALQAIKKLNPSILESIENLQAAYIEASKSSKSRLISPSLGNVVIMLILVVILAYLIIRTNKAYEQETKQRLAEIGAAVE